MKKINTIDLFAGCGGLCDGFEMNGHYNTLACVEWEKAPCDNLVNRLKTKWKYADAEDRVLRFDIQRTNELLNGWQDDIFGQNLGLNAIVGGNSVDLIIGGPPCQAYSLAGRVRDKNGMKDDYRNFLFESYVKIVKYYSPKAFVFENVPGILSARPTGKLIIDEIRNSFTKLGYEILDDLSNAIIDFSDYGVPQERKRVIILGLKKDIYGKGSQRILQLFYKFVLPRYKCEIKKTVKDAISDLPKLFPCKEYILNGKKYSHSFKNNGIYNHEPRWHSHRDQKIFNLLARDIETAAFKYISIEALKELYTKETGHTSAVHKYHVLRWDKPSNLIPAHLFKDGLRHIHPDSKQARSITVREAARLQGFSDDYVFVGNNAEMYKMIGNAVPPLFSNVLAEAVFQTLFANGD